jgi:hypothetical protein
VWNWNFGENFQTFSKISQILHLKKKNSQNFQLYIKKKKQFFSRKKNHYPYTQIFGLWIHEYPYIYPYNLM